METIAAEDTRRTQVLLAHISHRAPELVSLHEHNERSASTRLLERLQGGSDVALVSDAGTPLINDPGFALVGLAFQHGIRVVPIPGACSVTAALSVCPIPCQPFRFVGFLPARATARQTALHNWLQAPEALVFLEAPHRIAATLDDLAALTSKRIFVAREMTKQYETLLCGSAAEVAEQLGVSVKGEIVVVVQAGDEEARVYEHERVLKCLLKDLAPGQAAKLAAQICGTRKSSMYDLALRLNR